MRAVPTSFTAIVFWIFFPVLCVAQLQMGARNTAMGQATTALPEQSWSLFGNPAQTQTRFNELGAYSIRYFGLSELTDVSAAGTYQAEFGTLSFGVHRFGFDLFNETRVRGAYKNTYLGINYGLALNYTHVSIGEGFGSAGTFLLDLGLSAPLLPGLFMGWRAANITNSTVGQANAELPSEMALGMSYNLVETATFTFDVVKDLRYPVSYRSGLEVTLVEILNLRAGFTTEPQSFSFGLGVDRQKWAVNVVLHRHQVAELGMSPGVDLIWRF